MARPKSSFVCQACGYSSPKWLGRCPDCGGWNTMAEEVEASSRDVRPRLSLTAASPVPIDSVAAGEEPRQRTGISEFDRVLGGGLVAGSVVLVAGDPGVGKSTLLLQAAGRLAAGGAPVLYVSGEESPGQISLRARRLGVMEKDLLLLTEINVEAILGHLEATRPALCVIDSIQTCYTSTLTSAPGSVGQVREVAAQLIAAAKRLAVPLALVGHVTKDGAVAGPRVLEHMVDVVLAFEGEGASPYRILRGAKNRFGSTHEIGVFEMGSEGLREVLNPSATFLAQRPVDQPGSVVVVAMEGTRPILLEVQALVSPSSLALPRRMATGLDPNRLALLAAILEKRAGFALHDQDIYLNVAGGVRIVEPASDLGVACAIISSFRSRPVPFEAVCLGEVGLTGEVRTVPQLEARCKEAASLGFKQAIIPPRTGSDQPGLALKAVEVATLEDAFAVLFEKG
ncbi:MAG: DNA repair protein RadA [Nitrospinae bacterium]|nr:DNA repair protein RadA [Nitrospinota bacterium]